MHATMALQRVLLQELKIKQESNNSKDFLHQRKAIRKERSYASSVKKPRSRDAVVAEQGTYEANQSRSEPRRQKLKVRV